MKYLLSFLLIPLFSSPLLAEENVNDASSKKSHKCFVAFYNKKPEAFELCKKMAENEDINAQKVIGDMYYWGWNDTPKDYKQAVLWYKRAALKGQSEAKYNLGVLYETGKGVDADYEKSFKWFKSAAEDGIIAAQFNLGNAYSKGAGVKQNQSQAVRWYLRAADQGDVLSQYNLANRYAKGYGIAQDLEQAYKWYRLAGDQGDQDALKNIEIISQHMTEQQIARAKESIERWAPESEIKAK